MLDTTEKALLISEQLGRQRFTLVLKLVGNKKVPEVAIFKTINIRGAKSKHNL